MLLAAKLLKVKRDFAVCQKKWIIIIHQPSPPYEDSFEGLHYFINNHFPMKWKYIRYRHFFFILPGCRDVHGQLHPHRGYHYIIHFVILFSYATASSLCRLFVASTAACCARRAAARSSLLTNPSWNACLRAYNDPSYPSLAAIIQCLTALWRRPLFHSKQPRLCLADRRGMSCNRRLFPKIHCFWLVLLYALPFKVHSS